ncbi:MAG: hypothetical protein KFH98_07720 [Gemmatimonadetes bacterium]|nr:hypothetical protein [Gemmatimonadota bacterium]
MIMPAWLLLFWSGLAAASAAALIASAVGGVTVAAWSLAPAPRSRSHGAAWFLLAGVLGYPVAYGIAFELLNRADITTGLMLGAMHGILMFAVARRAGSTRAAFRAALAHLVYGAVMAFLYITP